MNLLTNILFLVVTGSIMGVYGFNLVINIIRAVKVNKLIKEDPQTLEATVVEIIPVKKRVFIKVRYTSNSNHQVFESIFSMTQSEFKDQYYEGQQLNLVFPKIEGTKRIHSFPVYLEGSKIKVEAGPLFTDALIFASGIFIFTFSLYNMLSVNAFSGEVPLISSGAETSSMNWLTILIFFVIYFVMMSYIMERLGGISKEHSENYLKICGLRAKAEVITYKLNRNKNQEGVRQADIKIEFRTNKGEEVKTSLQSFMYTSQPDQYIDILYDGRRPQVCVYLRS